MDSNLVQQFWLLLLLAAAISAYSAYGLLRNVITIRGTIADFVAVILANPVLQQPALQDGVRMAKLSADLLGGAAIAVMVFVPLRYTYLMFRVHQGHPGTLRSIQALALFGIAVELGKSGVLYVISMHNQVIKFGFEAGSLSLFVSLSLLWYSRLAPVQAFFSRYTIKRTEPPASESVAPAEAAA